MLATLAADPIASLVDTAFVGHLGEISQQQQQRHYALQAGSHNIQQQQYMPQL